MNILVTGGSGFLGRYVVAELLRRNHQVRLILRSQTSLAPFGWSHPDLTSVQLDLEQPDRLESALSNIEAVIHLAAAKTGDFAAQQRGTVTATENLLQAMTATGVKRLIAISTFSVYDYLHLPAGTTIDEDTPIDPNPVNRDGYAQTKLIQEQRVRQFQQQGGQVTILRPGIVYGRDAWWHASLGIKSGDRLWLRIGDQATLPLTYVENCAAAIVNAVERPEAIGKTLNLVDDNLPTQRVYADRLLARIPASPRVFSLSWPLMHQLANLAWQLNQITGGRLKLPGLLVPARLHARFKPFQYSNQAAKQILDWTPRYSLDAALDRSFAEANLLAVTASSS